MIIDVEILFCLVKFMESCGVQQGVQASQVEDRLWGSLAPLVTLRRVLRTMMIFVIEFISFGGVHGKLWKSKGGPGPFGGGW